MPCPASGIRLSTTEFESICISRGANESLPLPPAPAEPPPCVSPTPGCCGPRHPQSSPGHSLPPPDSAGAVLEEGPRCNGSNKLLLNN